MSSLQDSVAGLMRGAVIVFLGTLVGRGLSLAGEVLIVRSLSPATFGAVALAYTVVLALSRIGQLGIPGAIPRLLSDETLDVTDDDLIRTGIGIALGSGVFLAVLVFLFSEQLASVMGTSRLVTLLVGFVPFLLVLPLSQVLVAVLRAKEYPLGAVLSRNVGARIGGLGLFGTFSYFGRPVEGAIAYWAATPLLTTLIAGPIVSRVASLRSLVPGLPSARTVRTVWSFSWPLAMSTGLVTLMSSVDVMMVGFFLGAERTGFYRSVHPLRLVTQFVLRSFGFLFLPLATQHYSRGNLLDLRSFYRIASKWVAMGTLPLVLVFALFPETVVRVVFGPEYLPAATVLSILTAGFFFTALAGPSGEMIKAVDRPRVEMYASGVGLTLNVVLNWVLIPEIGISGAAVATVVGYLATNAVVVVAVYRTVGTHPFTVNSLLPLSITAVVAVGIATVVRGPDLGLFSLVVIGGAIVLIEAIALVVTGSVDESDLQLIRRLRRNRGDD